MAHVNGSPKVCKLDTAASQQQVLWFEVPVHYALRKDPHLRVPSIRAILDQSKSPREASLQRNGIEQGLTCWCKWSRASRVGRRTFCVTWASLKAPLRLMCLNRSPCTATPSEITYRTAMCADVLELLSELISFIDDHMGDCKLYG